MVGGGREEGGGREAARRPRQGSGRRGREGGKEEGGSLGEARRRYRRNYVEERVAHVAKSPHFEDTTVYGNTYSQEYTVPGFPSEYFGACWGWGKGNERRHEPRLPMGTWGPLHAERVLKLFRNKILDVVRQGGQTLVATQVPGGQ